MPIFSRKKIIILFLFTFPFGVCAQLSVTSLCVEHMKDPAVLDGESLRFSWLNMPSSFKIRGEVQTAYQISVASSEKALVKGQYDIWDTGKKISNESYLIKYAGKCLQSGQDYWWRVRVWNRKGKVSSWSKPAHWGMGLLKKTDWKAQWIGAPFDGPAPLFRKIFNISKRILKAKMYVSGLGYFEMYVNGRRIGDDYFVPNFTNYTSRPTLNKFNIVIDNKFRNYRVLYLSYDVTKMLQQGQNVVGTILGNGFYDCKYRWTCSFGKPCLLCQLEITYADGSKETVNSNELWEVRPSAIIANGPYIGEIYDARKETAHWAEKCCNATGWKQAILAHKPEGKLSAQASPTDKITEVLHPKTFKKLVDGSFEVDFGKEISGWIRFMNVKGKAGDTLKVKYECESLLGVQKYIFKGGETESYAPHFTWYVFRKAFISGISKLSPAQLQAEAVNTDVPLTAKFHTSNFLFNKINEIWQRSQLDNFHGCIASDCPHRERSPYTGDGQAVCTTVMHNFDAAAFYQKWIRDMRDVQNPITGYVPNGAPWQPGCGGGVAWGAAMDIIPWEYYKHYGDRKILEDNYDAMRMQAYEMLMWITSDSTMLQQMANYGEKEPNSWLNLGDWSPAFSLPFTELVHTFYMWLCFDNTSRAAGVLGNKKDSKYFGDLAKSVKKAFHHKFYNTDTKSYGDYGANIFALYMGVPPECRQDVINTLYHEIMVKYKGHINTGFLASKYFFEVLADNGLNNVAYAAMNKTDFPSFGHWIAQGATTTWEQWNGENSRNHPMFGSGLTWFYRSLAGIKEDENAPGYRHFFVSPVYCDSLDSVSYSNFTPYGIVGSEINHDSKSVGIKVIVPVGSTATVVLPTTDIGKVKECGVFVEKRDFKIYRNISGQFLVNVPQGTYYFRIQK